MKSCLPFFKWNSLKFDNDVYTINLLFKIYLAIEYKTGLKSDMFKGDCDKNEHCQAGLICGEDNCPGRKWFGNPE